jgi:hypothetical protein
MVSFSFVKKRFIKKNRKKQKASIQKKQHKLRGSYKHAAFLFWKNNNLHLGTRNAVVSTTPKQTLSLVTKPALRYSNILRKLVLLKESELNPLWGYKRRVFFYKNVKNRTKTARLQVLGNLKKATHKQLGKAKARKRLGVFLRNLNMRAVSLTTGQKQKALWFSKYVHTQTEALWSGVCRRFFFKKKKSVKTEFQLRKLPKRRVLFKRNKAVKKLKKNLKNYVS